MSRAETRAVHERLGAEKGFHRALGEEHSALFVEGGATLLVTFENLDHVTDHTEDRLPWGYSFVTGQGWSLLGLMAHGWTWYRDEAVFDFFDELRDGGFFGRFDRVVFYGASMGAYAAATFARAAPGATVIAISPQATLSREVAPWETRYRRVWRRDFSAASRYGYAPDGAAAANRAYLFYDPSAPLDAMHAALFQAPSVERYYCRRMGHRIASLWLNMGILKPVVTDCVDGRMTRVAFYRYLRRRRDSERYERALLEVVQRRGRPDLVRRLCRAVLSRRRGPRFRKALRQAEAELRARV
ncbi:MAG: phosphoadenosine phosphosulfate reductase [Paracoccaceae bacterium]|nr:phosphoadenosine phosphosulfate reductase [Paracoccaceae bacterium]